MRTFGGFRLGDSFFYGEVRGNDVHVLAKPYWVEIEPTGDVRKLADLHVDLPVASSKLIAVGLNYSDHIAEMKRTELGARSRLRLHNRPRYHRSRSAKRGKAIWLVQIVRHLHAGRSLRLCRCRCERSADGVATKRRGAATHTHEPDDLLGRATRFVRQ